MNTWTLTKDPNRDYFQSYKGRTIDPAKICRVYRNLHNGLFSIQQKQGERWLVVGHTSEIVLRDVTFEVNENGRQRVLREQKKYVHAYVCGYVCQFPQDRKFVQLHYNPYTTPYFIELETGLKRIVADYASLSKGQVYATSY